MSEPRPLRDMDPDERQLLKEAVCDAILERTRRMVSGDGEAGRTILGGRPSRVLSSGFILPRINENGDDEANDIRLAAHGLDLRVRSAMGTLRMSPTLAVYVRTFPSADDLFARDGRLIPRADLSKQAADQAKDQIRQRMEQEGAGISGRARRELRANIAAQVYRDMGVVVPDGAVIAGPAETDPELSQPAQTNAGVQRLRIPNRISRRYDVPLKWRRIDVPLPMLELSLPVEDNVWQAAASDYTSRLHAAIREACQSYIDSSEGGDWAWRRRRPESEDFWTPTAWESFLQRARQDRPTAADVIPQIQLQFLVQAIPDPSAVGCHSVRVALENIREIDSDLECGLFNVSIALELPEEALAPMRLERVKRSYHLSGFMTMPAIGVNGGVEDAGVRQGYRMLRTTWMPRYVLPRMSARRLEMLPTAYSRLSDQREDIEALGVLVDAMDAWRQDISQSTSLTLSAEEGDAHDEQTQRAQFQADVNAWEYERSRVCLGIDVLRRSRSEWEHDNFARGAIPYRAWILMNSAFHRANPPREGEPLPAWRLFQLAFILAHIPTLVSRLPEFAEDFRADFDEDAASLLYMSTGGGKTEAFFGTVVFSLYLDRLRGKHRGVTAMMHYPLRLLTVQQAQRLARILAHAEMVRRGNKIAGAPFEIGFWVGSGNTPNRTERRGVVVDELSMIPNWNDARARNELALLSGSAVGERGYGAAHAAWNKLPTCPFCRSETQTALRLFPDEHNRLGIVCLNSSCDWNEAHRGLRRVVPLPFLLADSDIYRRAPSVLLGTIDKLALIGQNTHTIDDIAGMFGMARAVERDESGLLANPAGQDIATIDDGHLKRVAPAFTDGIEVFHDPFPSLIIQDEMHLLEESLGTFGGIFETGLFAWLRRLAPLLGRRAAHVPGATDRPRLPHIIGATATVSDAAKHARALYQLRVRQFPHPGPSLYSTFYSDLAGFSTSGFAGERATLLAAATTTPRDRERAAPWGRVYASIMTNGRLHTVTTISVLAAHAATITRWQRDLTSTDPSRRQRAAQEIEDCVSDAPYATGRRAAVSRARAHSVDRLAALIDLHRIELTYVTNKKGGDQILAALAPEAFEAHMAMGEPYQIGEFKTELISGGIDIGGIQAVIRAAETPFDPLTDDISNALRVIVATSAISHGVDVEAFNSMAFAGMPSDIAEYIQASSRVGRTHVGFSLLIPTPQTRRDRFVVEVHESFHRLLERMIAPPAIERWADRAIARTVPSLLQTWLAGVLFQRQMVAAAAATKPGVAIPATVEQLSRVLSSPANLSDCAAFIREAVGIHGTEGAPTNPGYYTDLITQEVRRIEVAASSDQFTGRLGDFFSNPLSGLQRPMMSLRDVDAAGRIQASRVDTQSRRVDGEAVEAAMAFLRARGTRQTATSELDQEG
ncbi:DEAD/DEAH box helicase family protein [Rhizobium daejeonense]